MKQKKFRTKIGAQRFAGVTGYRAIRVKACKMADGSKGAWYRFVKGPRSGKKKHGRYGPWK